jgi:adenylate cyclase
VLLGTGFVVLDQALLAQRGWLLPLAAPLVTLAATAVLSLALAYWVEGRARRAMQRLFGTYVPPEIVARMAEAPQNYARAGVSAENRELTILFCDLRNFTTAAQGLAPDALREVVNLFFSRMTAVIRDHGGTLDKFIGDAIMAFWGAPLEMPDHAERAVAAALAMCREVEPINVLLRERGLPSIGLGIGLNTGVVCVGDLGSALRRSYTVIGDAVNLASRVEGLTREYGTDLLVGEATRDAAQQQVWVEIDQVRVKGRETPVRLFTPLDAAAADNHDLREELRAWSLALAAYRRQDWSTAEEILRRLVALPGAPRRYQRLLDLVDHLRQHPPGPDWDGVHRFESK